MRLISALVVAAHGLGFSMWFLASWIPAARIGAGAHALFSNEVAVTDPIGKATGVLALAVLVAFVATSWGMYTDASWWPPLALVTAIVSLVAIVIPWWSVVPSWVNGVGATVVDLLLILAVVAPSVGDRLTGR